MTALLFVDFESTSLDVDSATLLEVAWCITNLDGTQRTPLRSRYLMIAPDGVDAVHPGRNGMGLSKWFPAGGQRDALLMAEESGLYADWLACPTAVRIDDARELQRLILDDLLLVCDQGHEDPDPDPQQSWPPETVHLCGAGAARYDFSLLALHCPGVIRPGARYPVHYRPVDTSGNQTGLLGNNHEAEMIAWYMREIGDEDSHYVGDSLGIELSPWPAYSYADRDVASWLTGDKGRHRAAVDVARAIIVQRVLWHYGAGLRKALNV
jgi:hypothetical protein